MKRILISLAFIHCCIQPVALFSQNLLPDPGFEQINGCPTEIGQLWKCTFWRNPTGASPDLYHSCNNVDNGGNGDVGVPMHHGQGHQEAKEGEAYAGIFLGHWPSFTPEKDNYREYISAKISDSLEKGAVYRFSMFLALAKRSIYAVDRAGVYFSSDSVFTDPYYYENLKFTPQIESPQGVLLDDTLNWMEVSGFFVADAPYSWITIGNFYDYSQTTASIIRNYPPSESLLAYYYIDDLSLEQREYTITADLGPDLSICEGESIKLDAGDFPGFNYYWSTGDTGRYIRVDKSGNYSVIISNSLYEFGKDEIVVEVLPAPHVDLGDDTVFCYGESMELSAAIEGQSPIWSTGETSSAITIVSGGSYHIKVSNSCGNAFDTIVIRTIFCGIHIPISFTPNGDRVNDFFLPIVSGYGDAEYEMRIFNSWGQEVFFTNKLSHGWDGQTKGGRAPMGSYACSIRISLGGKTEEYRKAIVLLD